MIRSLILLAVSSLRQDSNEAEEAFKALRTKLATAKSLTLKFSVTGKGIKASGSVSVAEETKVRVEGGDRLFVSNGTDSAVRVAKEVRKFKAWSGAGDATLDCFLRYDFHGGFCVGTAVGWLEENVEPSKRIKLTEFSALPDEKVGERAAQKIKFARTITAKEGAAGVVEHVTLWIDRETGLPLQREWVADTRNDPQPVRETYSDVVLDGKVDPKTFDLP